MLGNSETPVILKDSTFSLRLLLIMSFSMTFVVLH